MRVNGQIVTTRPDDFPAVFPDLDLAEKRGVPKRSKKWRPFKQCAEVHMVGPVILPGHGHGMRGLGGADGHDALDAILHVAPH